MVTELLGWKPPRPEMAVITSCSIVKKILSTKVNRPTMTKFASWTVVSSSTVGEAVRAFKEVVAFLSASAMLVNSGRNCSSVLLSAVARNKTGGRVSELGEITIFYDRNSLICCVFFRIARARVEMIGTRPVSWRFITVADVKASATATDRTRVNSIVEDVRGGRGWIYGRGTR